jgi:hypothetical protein
MLVTPGFVKQEIKSTDKLIRDAGDQGEISFKTMSELLAS